MIRVARIQDADSIRNCAEAAYGLYVARIGMKPPPMVADFESLIKDRSVYVLEDETGIAGYIVFYPRGDHLHIENIAVDPMAQRRGYGKRLIAFVEAEARRRKIQAVELYTHQKMTENIAYYPKLGYREIDRHDRDGLPRVFFRKALDVAQ